MNMIIVLKILQMKRKNIDHYNEYEYIKTKKANIEIDKLTCELNNIDIRPEKYIKIKSTQPTQYEPNIVIKNNFNDIETKINLLKNLIQDKTLSFDSIIIITNDIINQYGKENYICGELDDNLIHDQIFSYISMMLYPTYLFEQYYFDNNFLTSCVNLRNSTLETICIDSKILFPTWKKKYNNINYDFYDSSCLNRKIYKKFVKKIFDFYEKVNYTYFNIMIGNIFSFILSNYKINFNPYDNKFNKNVCIEWINSFNKVMENCKKFIKNYAILIELEKIDELNKENLIKKIDKLNNVYKNILTGKNTYLRMLFKPLEKFYNPTTNNKLNFLIQENYLISNIKKEIESIFRFRNLTIINSIFST